MENTIENEIEENQGKKQEKETKILDFSKKAFFGVVIVLLALMVMTIILTFVIPKGDFKTTIVDGEVITDYSVYIESDEKGGVAIWKGLLAPILVLGSSDGIGLIMLCIFLMVIAGAFQLMSDCGGMSSIVNRLIKKFKDKKFALVAIIVAIFMLFGSFFGLFEEMLTLLPLIIMLALSLGYDSYTGFLMCIVATGFGFASALTNPFTVLTACNIIGTSLMDHIYYRVIILLVMYGLLLLFIFIHIKRIEKDPKKSPTYESDLKKERNLDFSEFKYDEKKLFVTYLIFLLIVLTSILVITSIESLRSLTVVFLIAIFLIGGLVAGLVSTKDPKFVFKSFLKGFISAAPAIVIILLASSIKYILVEGHVLATITNSINLFIEGRHPILVIIAVYILVLVLEFFITSSTAKAVFVMGLLATITTTISPNLLVLAYIFGDGYTNVLFPTSPVLLISLSMTGMSYFSWIKKSKFLILGLIGLILGFLILGWYIGY
ncbi:MAG: hypothetical protein IJS58_00180 [Bacilli bacterium]|nr:hypothetical protein [Bacilli bacterium]